MALEALAAEVRAVLGAARRLFGSAPQRAELSAENTGRTVGALDVQQHDTKTLRDLRRRISALLGAESQHEAPHASPGKEY